MFVFLTMYWTCEKYELESNKNEALEWMNFLAKNHLKFFDEGGLKFPQTNTSIFIRNISGCTDCPDQ